MNTTVFYAMLLVGAQVLINLLSYFAGLQTDYIRHFQYVQWVATLVIFVLLYLGADAKRKERPKASHTYGQAFLAVFLIGLLYSAVGAITHFVFFRYVNPDFSSYMLDFSRAQMVEQGIPEASIDSFMSVQTKLMSPGISSALGFVISIVMTLFLALTHAVALTRRRPLGRLLLIYAVILGALGLVFGALGGLPKGEFLVGGIKGLAINVIVAVAAWGGLLKFTGYAPDAPPEEPAM